MDHNSETMPKGFDSLPISGTPIEEIEEFLGKGWTLSYVSHTHMWHCYHRGNYRFAVKDGYGVLVKDLVDGTIGVLIKED
jgi:hypothetical protein